jgi:hypothetical protein
MQEPLKKIKQIDIETELNEIVSKRIRTAFIFAIAELENDFGHLWGEEKEESLVTPEEELWYDRFCQWRKNILDNGNNQIRLSRSEIKRIFR